MHTSAVGSILIGVAYLKLSALLKEEPRGVAILPVSFVLENSVILNCNTKRHKG